MKVKKCKVSNCYAIANDNGYCNNHQDIYRQEQIKINKRLNALPKHSELYQSYRWRTISKAIIVEHPYCSDPLNKGCNNNDNLEVHHIIKPVINGVLNEFLAFDESNLIVVCRDCHKVLNTMQARQYKSKDNNTRV